MAHREGLESHLPADGDGPLTVTRVKGTPISYRGEVATLGRPGRFDFTDAACALLTVGALAEARAAAGRIEDDRSVAYRDIGAWLADQGDTEEFFSDWKHYAAGRDRHGMAELRRRLVVGVAGQEGWRAALAVTNDKRIGPDFARYAFESCPVTALDGLRRAVAGVLSELDQLTVLARAVRLASGHDPERDHPLPGEIVDRIVAVDPVDRATMRWRDAELFGLWTAYGEQVTLDRVRAAVRTRGSAGCWPATSNRPRPPRRSCGRSSPNAGGPRDSSRAGRGRRSCGRGASPSDRGAGCG